MFLVPTVQITISRILYHRKLKRSDWLILYIYRSMWDVRLSYW